MPTLAEALRFAADPQTAPDQLREACVLLGLAADGSPAIVRERLLEHLKGLDLAAPVVCLNPAPPRPPGPRIPRPAPGDFNPVFTDEIALVPEADDFAALLRRQAGETRTLLLEFGERGAGLRYAPDRWTVREVVGHLADCERVLGTRALRIARGDQTVLPGFDAEAFVTRGGFEARTLASLREEFLAVRASTIALVLDLPPEALVRRGRVGQGTITVPALLYLIAGHERHHQRVLGERYLPLRTSPG